MKADIELVTLVKDGDTDAFSELVRRHQQALLRTIVRMVRDLDLAEDVTQEAFIKAYQKIHLFEGRASFKSWLFQIAVNTAKNKLRSSKRETVEIDKVNVAVSAQAEKGLVHQDIQEALIEEVERLPDKQRTALKLRIYEDLSFKEIAQIMDCPYDTAKANYRHGLMKIRSVFKENDLMRSLIQNYDDFVVPQGAGHSEVKT